MRLGFTDIEYTYLLLLLDGRRMKITAVHYEADSSSLAHGRHEYQGTSEELEGCF